MASTTNYKFNEMFHSMELYLDNSGDFMSGSEDARYYINPASILNLSITDTLCDWVVDGSITFTYLPEDAPAEGPESTGNSRGTQTNGSNSGDSTIKSYQFRNDGFDLLRVMVVPNTYEGDGFKIDQNDPKWILSYLFSVYDVEDINDIPGIEGPLASYVKCLKLHFRDVRYQILKTTNLEWSTATSPNVEENPDFANKPVLKTGQALKEVLEEALTKEEKGGAPLLFEFPGELDWDIGKSQLFYTSPAGYSALDDIDYLFSHHVSEKKLELDPAEDAGGAEGNQKEINDLCLFHTKRPKDNTKLEQLCITPISNFFEKAGKEQNSPGELQLEHFFVTAFTKEKPKINLYRAPITDDSNSGVDLKTFKYGQMISYSFVDMSSEVNSSVFCTTPVYSVDIGKRIFHVEFKGNDVKAARYALAKSYISHLYNTGSDPVKLFLPPLHKSKENINVFPTFSLNGDNLITRQRNGLHNLLFTGLFQNACICFKTFGLTLRETGSFIGIDKVGGCDDNDYNNKLYGQWFVVKVDHFFEAGSYMNYIYAIKMHRFKEKQIEFAKLL